MSLLNLTAKQIYDSVTKKLHLEHVKVSRETTGDYYLDGKYQFRVTMPNVHGGSGSVSTGWLKVCRESVFLSTAQYADLVRCPMTEEKYTEIIREKIAARKK